MPVVYQVVGFGRGDGRHPAYALLQQRAIMQNTMCDVFVYLV